MFTLVTDLLMAPAPPALRAALFQVLSRIPGVELGGPTTDPVGRPGVSVVMNDPEGFRNELVIEPDTGTFLSLRQVLTKRVSWMDAEPGMVVAHATLLATGVVDSMTAKP
jgi:hypothetical protein